MILVWGALTDEPVVRVLEALDDGVAEVVHIEDSAVAESKFLTSNAETFFGLTEHQKHSKGTCLDIITHSPGL